MKVYLKKSVSQTCISEKCPTTRFNKSSSDPGRWYRDPTAKAGGTRASDEWTIVQDEGRKKGPTFALVASMQSAVTAGQSETGCSCTRLQSGASPGGEPTSVTAYTVDN